MSNYSLPPGTEGRLWCWVKREDQVNRHQILPLLIYHVELRLIWDGGTFFFTDSGMLLHMAVGICHRSPLWARIVLWSKGQKLAGPWCCVMFNSIFQSLSPAGPVPPTLLYFNVQHSWSQVGRGKGHLFVFGKPRWWRGMTFSFGQVNGKKVRLMLDHWTPPPLLHWIITFYLWKSRILLNPYEYFCQFLRLLDNDASKMSFI